MENGDEIFKRLGYEKVSLNFEDGVIYRKKDRDKDSAILIMIDFDLKSVCCRINQRNAPMTFEEINACAQFLKEREKSI